MPASLSVCIITRNDATLISRCLTSVRSISDDIIVVDTGSTDETVAEALRLGARVERFAWCDDFSAARNYALGFARGEWILVLDTDETLAPAQETILHHLTGQSGVHGFRCQIRNALPGGNEFISQVTRLFRNDPRIRFSGRVHEQVEPALQKLGKQAPACDLTIVHTGYGVDEATNRAKAERNLKGLLLDFDETPSNLFLAIKIGQLYLTCGDPDRALEYLSRGVGVGDPALAAEGYNGIAGIRAGRGEFESALRACAESIARAQYQRMAYVLVSQILHAMGRHQDAESQLAIARSMRGPSQLHADLPIIGG